MPVPVVVSLLLKASYSHVSQHDALRRALDALGLSERMEGRASWTVRVDPGRFEKLFRVRLVQLSARPPGPSDKGAPPGYACEEDPCMPESLLEFVESVGVEPPMTRFNH